MNDSAAGKGGAAVSAACFRGLFSRRPVFAASSRTHEESTKLVIAGQRVRVRSEATRSYQKRNDDSWRKKPGGQVAVWAPLPSARQ